MHYEKMKQYLQPSGLNSHFYGENLLFDEYIELTQQMILKSRLDLTEENTTKIVNANSPFELPPPATSMKPDKGVLLIHGLFDSPFYLRDLGDHLSSKGFLVRAILLPGHGTVAGDLLKIDYTEWVKAVTYGVKSLLKEVHNIYLIGYSLGGVLALNHFVHSHTSEQIKGLILFAPALKPRSIFKNFLARYYPLYRWAGLKAKWYQIRESTNYVKYSCYALNAGFQACRLIDHLQKGMKHTRITIPLFVAISSDDETISPTAILSFFLDQPHPKNKLLIYTNNQEEQKDQRIITRASAYPQLKIIDFSHSCLTIAPQNSYLGGESQFLDLYHYPNTSNLNGDDFYLGAATRNNLKNYLISRLSYNPDFENLTKNLDDFFESIG